VVNKDTEVSYTLGRRKWLIIEVKCWACSMAKRIGIDVPWMDLVSLIFTPHVLYHNLRVFR